MDTLWQDLRYALRTLSQAPGFAAVAILTLALGIGANAAIFSVVNGVLLRPLPYPHPDKLVMVWETNPVRHFPTNVVNPGNYLVWRDRAASFSGLAAVIWSTATFTDGTPQIVPGQAVTPNFFGIVGTPAALGRTFTAAQGLPNAAPVIVLSDGLWRERFGADSGIIGRQVRVAGGTVTVVGVMPPGFQPMPYGQPRYWKAYRLDPNERPGAGRYAMVIGRLAPRVTREQAQSEMNGVAAGLAREYPGFDTDWGANVVSLRDQLIGSSRVPLWIALGAVAVVLLIACANVANLMLVRLDGRRREFAVRVALGASRWQLARQWLVESVIVAAIGGCGGLLLATWGVDLLVAAKPSSIPRLGDIAVDGRVLLATAAVALFAGLAAGLPSTLEWGGRSVGNTLHGGGIRSIGDPGRARLRSGLAVAQIALALVLLAGAGLLVRSMQRLLAVDPGFDPAGLFSFSVELPSATYRNDARVVGTFDRLIGQIRALPGVSSAGAVSYLPLNGGGAATGFTVVGRPVPPAGRGIVADIRIVDTGYFGAMRIPLQGGRRFAALDRAGAPPVVIINAALARKYWPGANPVGAHLKIDWFHPDVTPEIIGVVGDVRSASLDEDPGPMIYYPEAQEPTNAMTVVARSSTAATALGPAARRVAHDLDADLPVSDLATMDERVTRSLTARRFPMLLLGAFAVLAVVLAAIGVYGVLSYAVTERRREFGLRMALGATAGELLRGVLARGLQLAATGVAIGLLVAALTSRALGSLLYGVTPTDPPTLLGVAGFLVLIAILAVLVPARRATRVDPMVTLRAE